VYDATLMACLPLSGILILGESEQCFSTSMQGDQSQTDLPALGPALRQRVA